MRTRIYQAKTVMAIDFSGGSKGSAFPFWAPHYRPLKTLQDLDGILEALFSLRPNQFHLQVVAMCEVQQAVMLEPPDDNPWV